MFDEPVRVARLLQPADDADAELLTSARILIIDDEPSNTTLLTRILQAEGVTAINAVNDSRLSLETFLSFRPDLVLLDLHMPYMDGHAVMRALHSATEPEDLVPILVLTADATPSTRSRALSDGAKDFLTKPFDRTELLLRLRNQLQTRALYSRLQTHTKELEARVRTELDHELSAEQLEREKRRRVSAVLDRGTIAMVIQPIFHLASGTVVGAEALARFSDPPHRTPDLWFDEAAEVGLGVQLELHAVTCALRMLPLLSEDVYLSVNLSPEAVTSAELLAAAERWPGSRLVVEITEQAEAVDYDRLCDALGSLRTLGVRVAVDDAGAELSGLQHILRVRPDIVKLGMALTRKIDQDPIRRALTASLVGFAREMNATLVAEGVETAAEVDALCDLGVPCAQGFYLARPAAPPLGGYEWSSAGDAGAHFEPPGRNGLEHLLQARGH